MRDRQGANKDPHGVNTYSKTQNITDYHGGTRNNMDHVRCSYNRGNLNIDSLLFYYLRCNMGDDMTTMDKLMLLSCQIQLQKTQVENT